MANPARNQRAKFSDPAPVNDRLPPNSPEAEQGLIGCCLLNPALMVKECATVRSELFYDLRHATIWDCLKLMAARRDAIDLITLQARLKKQKQLEDVGGLAYLTHLPDTAPSPANWEYYLIILREKFTFRQTVRVCTEAVERLYEWEGDASDFMTGLGADLETLTELGRSEDKPVLKIWSTDEILKYKIPEHLRLVGDNEICAGYDGTALIAGPGSSGKSLAVASLALAGAIGKGTWMGRQVHRQFKTLILQAENGSVRLKGEIEALARNHPKVDINSHIFISEPPEGGLPFQKGDFRAAVRREILRLKPSLVVVDPWSQVATEDGAKEVVDMINLIRSCFPSGDECPGLLIVAHTKKPRPEDVKVGRGLIYLVGGSVALGNTCRCGYVLLPWSHDTEDDRIYWTCAKLNNGQMYAASVWKRRFGTFFEHDPETDPKSWGREENTDDQKVKESDLVAAFKGMSVMSKSTLAKNLEEADVCSYQTGMRIITKGRGGYLADLVEVTKEGWLKLKEGN